jgi:hypothetical protein
MIVGCIAPIIGASRRGHGFLQHHTELAVFAMTLNERPLSRTEWLIFRTEANHAELMRIYGEKLASWPLPFEASFVTTRYGKTHVIASGDPASPPLVLTHPAGCGSFVWSSIMTSTPSSESKQPT